MTDNLADEIKQQQERANQARLDAIAHRAKIEKRSPQPQYYLGHDDGKSILGANDGSMRRVANVGNVQAPLGSISRLGAGAFDPGISRRPQDRRRPGPTGVIKLCLRVNLPDRTVFWVGGHIPTPKKILELPLSEELVILPYFEVIGPEKSDWLFTLKTRKPGTIDYRIRTIYGDGRSFDSNWNGKLVYLLHQGNGFWQGGLPIPNIEALTQSTSTFYEIDPCSPRYSTYSQIVTVTTTTTGWQVFDTSTNTAISSAEFLANTPYDPAIATDINIIDRRHLTGTCVAFFDENSVYTGDKVSWTEFRVESDFARSTSLSQFWGTWYDGAFAEWRGSFSENSTNVSDGSGTANAAFNRIHTWEQYITPTLSGGEYRDNQERTRETIPSQFIERVGVDQKNLATRVFQGGYIYTEVSRSFGLTEGPFPQPTTRLRINTGVGERDIAQEPPTYPTVSGYGPLTGTEPTAIPGQQLRYSVLLRENGVTLEDWLKAKKGSYNLREGDDMAITVVQREEVKKVPIRYSQIGGSQNVSVVGGGYWPRE